MFTLLLTGVLVVRKVRGGIFIGLVAGTWWQSSSRRSGISARRSSTPVGGASLCPRCPARRSPCPTCPWSAQFSLDSFGRIGVLAAVMLVFTLVFANFFDAMGTFTGLSREAGVADEHGNFPRLRSALIVEGAGAVVGGATSASSNTVFLESAAGIEEGARTGLGEPGHRRAVLRRDVRDAACVDRADRGGRGGAGHRRRDDVLAPARHRFLGVLGGAAGRADRGGHAAVLLDRQRNRHRLHRMGRRALGAGKAREISPLLWIAAAGFLVYFARGWIESLIGM